MHGLVLVDGDHWNVDEVRSSNDVALQGHEIRKARVSVVVDVFARYSDLFPGFGVDHVPRAQVAVFSASDFKRGLPVEDQVDVFKLISLRDNTRNNFVLNALFNRVHRLSHSQRVEVSLLVGNVSLTEVHFSEFPRVGVDTWCKLVNGDVSVS